MQYLNSDYLAPGTPFRLRGGEDQSLEDQAALLLADSRKGVTALSDKRDFLTRDQLALRAQKEVPNSHGFSDESLMRGMFKKAYNPLSRSRPQGQQHEE